MKKQYDIVGNRKKFFIFSAVLIVFILLFSVIFGVEMDIQFKGGAMLTYSYTGELDISAVQKDIESTLGSNVTLQIRQQHCVRRTDADDFHAGHTDGGNRHSGSLECQAGRKLFG